MNDEIEDVLNKIEEIDKFLNKSAETDPDLYSIVDEYLGGWINKEQAVIRIEALNSK